MSRTRTYAVSAVVMLGLDLLWLGVIAPPLYQRTIGPLLRPQPDLVAAALFYTIYLVGVNELVIREERMRALYVLMGEALGPVTEINPVFVELNRSFRSAACSRIQAGIDAGEIRPDVDPDAEAAAFIGMLRGVAVQWVADRGCFDIEAVRESMKKGLRRQLAAPETNDGGG